MKIATWNINSVRHRIGLVTRFLRDEQPDVLCLQETKVMNELFPAEPSASWAMSIRRSTARRPITGWRCSRACPSAKTGVQDFCREGHARHMGVTFENGVELHNFYVPGRRRHSRSQGERRNSPTSCISWREMAKFFARAQGQAQRPGDAGGRSQCRAAGK